MEIVESGSTGRAPDDDGEDLVVWEAGLLGTALFIVCGAQVGSITSILSPLTVAGFWQEQFGAGFRTDSQSLT